MNIAKQSDQPGFIQRFLSVVEKHPDFIAVETETNKITYREMKDLIESYRKAYEELGLAKTEMVIMILPNGAEFVANLYALASLESVAIPASDKNTDHELAQRLDDAQPVGVITTEALFLKYKNILEKREEFKFIFVIDQTTNSRQSFGKGKEKETISLEDFQGKSPLIEPEGDPIITCHYTYKGVGYPLGVKHHYRGYSFCIDHIQGERLKFPVGATSLAALPFYTIFGTLGSLLSLAYGYRQVILKDITKNDLLETLEKYNVDYSTLVPSLCQKFLHCVRKRKENLPHDLLSKIHLISGGSFLDPDLVDQIFDEAGTHVTQGYGHTESLTPIMITQGKREGDGTLGTPVSREYKVKILDANGSLVPRGQTGEIAIAGPSIAGKYYNKPEESRRFFKDGYFLTGDLGFLDKRGYLHFVGRCLPMTKIMTQMVDITEIEKTLLSHPNVEKVKVTVQGRLDKNSYLQMFVQANSSFSGNQKDLKDFCKKFLSRHKIPFKVEIYRAGEKKAMSTSQHRRK